MASGGSGSRSFEFGSDDILCSYDDYSPQDPANGKRSDPSTKDFHESRMGRPLVDVYGQQEEYRKEDVLSAVEGCMKKYADNLLRFLEGISGRLTQLELYYYKLERSIGDLRSDMVRDQIEKDHQLKSLEKHLQEVHRSVQILKDKQELSETQKELAKIHLVPKESTTSSYSQRIDEGVPPPVSEPKIYDDTPDISNQPLALVPHQSPTRPLLQPVTPQQNKPYNELSMQQPAPSPLNMQPDSYIPTQSGTFYPQHQSLLQNQQGQSMQSEVQYGQPRPQFQNQVPAQQQPIPQYQQQWPQPSSQQFSQQSVQPQQPPPQALARPQTATYPPYPPHQPSNQATDAYPGSMPMQVPYSTIPRPGGSRSDSVSFSYGSPGSISQPQSHQNVQRPPQPQVNQSSFGPPMNKGVYTGTLPYPPQTSVPGYNTIYNTDGRSAQNFQPGSYPPNNISALQNQQVTSSNTAARHPAPQLVRNHPYGEMIEKAASMGYPRDMVVSAIHRMGETGQPIDFNALLDRLNTRVVGAPPRGWSG